MANGFGDPCWIKLHHHFFPNFSSTTIKQEIFLGLLFLVRISSSTWFRAIFMLRPHISNGLWKFYGRMLPIPLITRLFDWVRKNGIVSRKLGKPGNWTSHTEGSSRETNNLPQPHLSKAPPTMIRAIPGDAPPFQYQPQWCLAWRSDESRHPKGSTLSASDSLPWRSSPPRSMRGWMRSAV